MIQITADTRRAVVTNKELLTVGSAGIQVQFTLSEDWDALSKLAVFRVGDDGTKVDVVLGESLTCVVPPEVLTEEDEVLFIGIYGTNGQGTVIIPTIWASAGVVKPGTIPNTPASAEPTPEIWAQILSVAQDAEQTATDAMSIVEDAVAHTPIIQDGYWYFWNEEAQEYQSTGIKAEGEDGYSPDVTIADITGGHSVTITDEDHPQGQTFNVLDGTDGEDGEDGEDGYSPAVTITEITGGHRVTITDETHPQGQSFDVMDGSSDAGGVTYDETQTYSDGSVGKELSNQKNAISQLDDDFKQSQFAPPQYTEIANIEYSGSPSGNTSGKYTYRNSIIVNVKSGKNYRVVFQVNKFSIGNYPVYVRTTNSDEQTPPASSFIDSVFPDGLTPILGKIYYANLIPTANGKRLSLFFNGVAGTELDYKIKVYEISDISFIYSENAFYTNVLHDSVTLETTTASRLFYPFKIKKGQTYVCKVSLSGFDTTTADVFDLSSNGNGSSADIIERLIQIPSSSFYISGNYSLLFKPTKDAEYIYIYSNYGTAVNPTLTFEIYEFTSEKYAYDIVNPPITIYGIGDSIMFVGTFLKSLKLNHNIDYIAYAEGSTGYSTNNNDASKTTFYDRVATMSSTVPDLILIEGGTNDFSKDKTIAETEDGVKRTLNNLATKYPGVPVLVMLPTQRNYTGAADSPHYMTNNIGIDLADYVEAIKGVVNRYGYKTIDLYHESGLNAASSANDTGVYNSALLTSDGLHWTDAFHERIAKIIYPIIVDYATD